MIHIPISSHFAPYLLDAALFLSSPLPPPAANNLNPSTQIYQLDLFSIISFGLSIAATVITCFMGSLSFKFYNESKKDFESTQKALVRIDSLASNIEVNMMDIIRRIISAISSDSTQANGMDTIEKKIDNLSQQFDKTLSEKIPENNPLKKEVTDLFTEMKNQADSLKKSGNDLKIKSLESVIDKIDQGRDTYKIFDLNKYERILGELKREDQQN